MAEDTDDQKPLSNGRRIPWKSIISILAILGVGGGGAGYQGWAQLQADTASIGAKYDTIMPPLITRVTKSADSISALDKAVGIVATEVTNIKEGMGYLRDDIQRLANGQAAQLKMQQDILSMLTSMQRDRTGRP